MGKNLLFLPSCQSTNEELSARTRNTSLPDGTLLITDNQTAGRGQRDNTWESEPGKNLTFTILFYPKGLAAKNQFNLNMAVSLGISDALLPYMDSLKIKWPNDIYAGRRKLGGILIKNNLKGHLITTTITGIGLNINQQGFSLPNAVSLSMLTGDHYELPFMLDKVCYAIEGRYLAMLRGADLKTDYLNRLYLWNKSHMFSSGGTNFHGAIRDVKPSGELIIETEQGMQEFRFKEVEPV